MPPAMPRSKRQSSIDDMRAAALAAALCLTAACAPTSAPPTPQAPTPPPPVIGMANPASVDCARKGGETRIIDGPGGQIGVCAFPDGRRCEEWALFRDNRCVAARAPLAGSKTSGKKGG